MMYLLPFPILGALLAWGTVYYLGFRKQMWGEFLLGLAAFFIAMVVQSPVQQLPLLGMGIKSNADVIARGAAFTAGVSIWLGLVAGIVQEGIKYLLVKGKSLTTGVFLGLGFGVTEALVLAGTALAGALATGTSLNVPASTAILSLMERYFTVLFHVATAVYLAYTYRQGYGKEGLITVIALHTVIDSLAAYYQLTKSGALLYAVEALVALIAIALMYITIPKAREEFPKEEAVMW